jgi:succinate-acetate transporter protein
MSSTAMQIKFPNPAPLGLAGFALTTWLLSMINAGWFSADSMGLVLGCALAYGGTAQAIAGVMELPRGNTFGATAFVGWYLFLWGVFTFYMWLATFRSPRALQFIFLGMWITFFLLAAGDWTGSILLHTAGGYCGLVTAILAFYLSAAQMLNETYGRVVLPVGEWQPAFKQEVVIS